MKHVFYSSQILTLNVFVHQSPTNSLTDEGFFVVVFLRFFKIQVIELSLCDKNISMLNVFTLDAISVCHSLGQSVTTLVNILVYTSA